MTTTPVEPNRAARNWQAAMQHFLQAEAEYQRIARATDEDAREKACDAYSDAQSDLIRMQAPDLAALRWKLDHLLGGSNGTIDPWDLSYLDQTKRDIGRLMAQPSDNAIRLAWERRLTALRIYNTLPEGERGRDDEVDSLVAAKCWEEMDAAEEEIRKTTATSVEGARIQVHCAMLGMVGAQREEAALLAGDMAAFAEREDHLDYPVRLVFSALRSLTAMEKAA